MLQIEQTSLLSVDLSVLFSLVLDVSLDDLLVGILAYRVHIETTGPEVATPEKLLDCRVFVEDVFGGETFDDLNNFGWGKDRNALDEEMDMIHVCPDFDKAKFVAGLDFQADLFQGFFHGFGKGFSSVFHRTDQVVEEEGFVMALADVITHPMMLHLREPTPHATCEVSRNETRDVHFHSPRINFPFFCLVQPLICISRSRANDLSPKAADTYESLSFP